MNISEYEYIIKNPSLVNLPNDTRFFINKKEANSYNSKSHITADFLCKTIYLSDDIKNLPNSKGQFTFDFDNETIPVYCVSFSKLKSVKHIVIDKDNIVMILPLTPEGLLDDRSFMRVQYKDENGFYNCYSEKLVYSNGSEMNKIKENLESVKIHIKFDSIITNSYIKNIRKEIKTNKKLDNDKLRFLTGFSLKTFNSIISEQDVKISKNNCETIINAINTILGR